jgi:tRNA (guanosine-2'-O-)-methyltransferase
MKLYNKNHHPLSDERNERIHQVLQYRQNDLTVILENVNDPHNIAAVLRSCDAVGIMEIFVLNTKSNTYKNFDVRKSSSANKWMVVHQYTNVKDCFSHVRKLYKAIYSTHLNEHSKDLYALNLTQSVAMVFGNERNGISPETLALCDGNFIIPQVGMIQSLNISVACAVSLYEAFRQKSLQAHYVSKKINKAQETMLLKQWEIKTS